MQTEQVRIESVQCISPAGLHRMFYKDWGDVANPNILVCVHGVTRVADDFDVLARELMRDYRVICPDVVGRGRSDWLKAPQYYQLPQYVSDMVTLLARLNTNKISYLGTSMGGMIGMVLASLPENPIQKLILNDIGPAMNLASLEFISDYIGQSIKFSTFDEAAQYIRSISPTFGQHTEEQWNKIAKDVLRQDKDGSWIKHYDLNIAIPMRQGVNPEALRVIESTLWAQYDAIRCPTLLLRGAESALISEETAIQMTERGPKAQLVEFPKVGHAPTLVHAEQIAPIREFLLRSNSPKKMFP